MRSFIATILIGSVALTVGHAVIAQTSSAPPQPAVVTASVRSEALAYEQAFSGRVTAVQRIDLRARVSGFVTAIDFEEGQKVEEGTVLFEIEPDAYEAAVTQVQGQIASAEAEKKLADIELARQTELVKKQAAAETTAQQAEANVGNVEGKLTQLQGALQQAQLDLTYTKVAAPFAGRIGLTDIDIGAFVGPESGVLASLSSIDPIHVTFPVPEAVLIEFRKRMEPGTDGAGVTAGVVLATGDRYEHEGRVTVIDSEVQEGTDTILLRAEFDNPDGHLRDGQLVTIDLTEPNSETVLTIPVKALQRDQAGYFVMSVSDAGEVAKTPIEVARIAGTSVAIASGLEEGQQVITDGLQKVRPGMKVTVQPADAGSTAQPVAE